MKIEGCPTKLEQDQGSCIDFLMQKLDESETKIKRLLESRQIARIASHIRDDDRFEPA